jgi:uncharacterized protein (TIGR04255 family)
LLDLRHNAAVCGVYVIMNDMVVSVGSVHYRRPPVRKTRFTVYFKPLDFDLGLITKLCDIYEDDYPGVKQRPPGRRPTELPSADPFGGASWPMPAVELVNKSLSRTIRLQFDHFSLGWRFDADAPNGQYPSYEVLADELIAKFAEFVRVVDDVSDATVEVQGCECYYSNALESIGPENWLSGYLTDWSQTDKLGTQLDGAEHFALHTYREDVQDGVNRTVRVDLDAGKKQRPELDINVIAVHADSSAVKQSDPIKVSRVLMDSAHQLENQTFERSFSDEMKAEWEAQR